MVMDETCEVRTLMIADVTAALLPAHASGGAGGCESDGGRKSGLVGAEKF